MTFSAEELELLDAAFAELHACGMELTALSGRLPRLLIGLLNAALREYQHLKLGLKHSTPMVAWACRNLLELHIYTRYALSSEDAAGRLISERLNDGVEIFDAFQTWLARNDPALLPPSVDEALRVLNEQKADAAAADAPPLKLKRMAADVGLSDEFTNMTRLAQKLAHPNAFGILEQGEENEIATLRPFLFRAGAGHGLEILRAIREADLPRNI